ncbi:hypothetical protein FRC03_012245 [Tulasnella sp. 419]|nr:hypothetical protein FRC03_012245 [Tulasnella sp. 419]
MGYESGSTEYFRIVEHFVRKRANECLLSEKLHAIWLLASVPYSGGRVFEIGDVDMMKMALEYRIPLVVVFTKYDLLVTQTEIEMTDSLDDSTPDPPTAEEIKKEASVNADDVFRRTCITPLREMPLTGWNLPSPPPYTRVSIMTGYENTLMELVKLTERNIPKALWLTWASAQRIDTQTSIKAFIARLFQSSRDESNYQQATMAGTLMCEAINVTGRLKKAGKTPVAIGGNSDVWKGSLRDTGRMNLKRQPVAIKVLRNVRIRSREDTTARMLTRLQREIRVWEQLSHENVVPLLGFAFEDQSPCMVAPWYENGTVLNYINVKPSANRSKLSLNVLDGLIYMHSFDSPIIHGDLRGSNILVDDRGCARISDFGLSRICQDGPSGYTTSSVTQGSARWMAPELFRHDKRTIASDMYAYGLVAMEICSGGTIPFRHLSHLEFLAAIVQEASPKRVHYGLTDLPEHILLALEATWSWNPDDRPSAIDMRAMCTRPSIIQTS